MSGMYGFPGGFGYQAPGLPPVAPFPTPFPQELGAFGPLAFMGLQQTGMLPPGAMNFSFNPTTDLWTQQQTLRHYQDRAIAMSQATRGDINTLTQYQRSLATASGADWSKLSGRADQASQWIGSMLPTLSMYMPEAVDMAMGPRGSQTVMAGQLANASRFAFDSTTGRMGMRGAEIGELSNQFYSRLYGTDTATASMRGLGAGRAGIMYNEILSRGLVGDDLFTGGPQGRQLDSGKMDQHMSKLKDMTRIITSIGDLFGANGRPNAPIPELLNALDTLGAGLEYRYGGAQVESIFRNFQQATATGKISLPEMSRMVTQNQALLASVGGDPRDAMALTMRSVNYAAGSANVFSSPFYGRMDPRTLATTAARLETAGMASPAGQLAQIALYLDAASPGLQGEFKELVQAIRNPNSGGTFAGGKSILDTLQSGDFRGMYIRSGGAASNFDAAIMNPSVANQFSIQASSAVRSMQFNEATSRVGSMMGGVLGGMTGVSGEISAAAGGSLMKKIFDQAGRLTGLNPAQQAEEIERIAAESIASAGGGDVNQIRNSLKGKGAGLWATMSGAVQHQTGMEFNQAVQALNPRLIEAQNQREAAGRINAGISQALGDLGRYSFSQRLADELLKLDPNKSIGSAFASVLGVIPKDKITAALNQGMRGGTIEAAMGAALKRIQSGQGTAEDAATLREAFGAMRETLASGGIDFDEAVKTYDNLGAAASTAASAGMMISGGLGMAPGMLGSSMLAAKNSKGAAQAGPKPLDIKIHGTLTINKNGTATISGGSKGEGPVEW